MTIGEHGGRITVGHNGNKHRAGMGVNEYGNGVVSTWDTNGKSFGRFEVMGTEIVSFMRNKKGGCKVYALFGESRNSPSGGLGTGRGGSVSMGQKQH